jgi:glycogen operon protein
MMEEADWQDSKRSCLGMLLDGRARPTGIRQLGGDISLLLIVHNGSDPSSFSLPQVEGLGDWQVLLSTDGQVRTSSHYEATHDFPLAPRSMSLFRARARRRDAGESALED